MLTVTNIDVITIMLDRNESIFNTWIKEKFHSTKGLISGASKTKKQDTDAEIWRIIYQMKFFSTDRIDRLWGFGFVWFLFAFCILKLRQEHLRNN